MLKDNNPVWHCLCEDEQYGVSVKIPEYYLLLYKQDAYLNTNLEFNKEYECFIVAYTNEEEDFFVYLFIPTFDREVFPEQEVYETFLMTIASDETIFTSDGILDNLFIRGSEKVATFKINERDDGKPELVLIENDTQITL